jgi:hypothetical protein
MYRFRSKGIATSPLGNRLHGILLLLQQQQDSSQAICFQVLTPLLSAWKRVSDTEFTHRSDRFEWTVLRCFCTVRAHTERPFSTRVPAWIFRPVLVSA